ncbi:MAG: hypothetical protein HC848_05420 [Limnobacter sp.]|nr:hypothetical protein [Limnobacter sp.]
MHSVVLFPRFALQELGAAPVDSGHVAACGVVAVRLLAHLPVDQRLLEKAMGLLGYYPRGYKALCRRAKLLGGSLRLDLPGNIDFTMSRNTVAKV